MKTNQNANQMNQMLNWHPTAAEVRTIVTEMRPIIEAEAMRAEHDIEQARR